MLVRWRLAACSARVGEIERAEQAAKRQRTSISRTALYVSPNAPRKRKEVEERSLSGATLEAYDRAKEWEWGSL
eukprot:3836303-Lingulodinium_polyedra.AAC.1